MLNLYKLTDAEYNVMLLAVKGYSVSYIADKLCVSPQTIANHLNHVYSKYGIANDKDINPRARAAFIFMGQQQERAKLNAELDAISEHIKQYKQWIDEVLNDY